MRFETKSAFFWALFTYCLNLFLFSCAQEDRSTSPVALRLVPSAATKAAAAVAFVEAVSETVCQWTPAALSFLRFDTSKTTASQPETPPTSTFLLPRSELRGHFQCFICPPKGAALLYSASHCAYLGVLCFSTIRLRSK